MQGVQGVLGRAQGSGVSLQQATGLLSACVFHDYDKRVLMYKKEVLL